MLMKRLARRIKSRLMLALAAGLLLGGPGIATSRADILYVANSSNSTIQKYTSGGVGSLFANSGLGEPYGLAFDNTGNLYAANAGNNTIEKFTAGVGSVFANSGLNAPIGLAFDSAGNLYASNADDSTIEKFSPSGTDLGVFASGLSGPTGWPLTARAISTWQTQQQHD